MRDPRLTCFDHNCSKSTNFLAIEVVPNAARGDLSVGAINIFHLRVQGFSTCFDPNSSKSRNFLAVEVVPNRSRGDLSAGATHTPCPDRDLEMKRSRESQCLTERFLNLF